MKLSWHNVLAGFPTHDMGVELMSELYKYRFVRVFLKKVSDVQYWYLYAWLTCDPTGIYL